MSRPTHDLTPEAQRKAEEFRGDASTPCRACSVPLAQHHSTTYAFRTRHWFVPPRSATPTPKDTP